MVQLLLWLAGHTQSNESPCVCMYLYISYAYTDANLCYDPSAYMICNKEYCDTN